MMLKVENRKKYEINIEHENFLGESANCNGPCQLSQGGH